MSKQPLQNKAKQTYSKARDAAPIKPYQESERMKAEDVQTEGAVEDGAIQLRAYQIYQEKGGPALDNWLEAEHILKSNGQLAVVL
jgi:hypothetical protein